MLVRGVRVDGVDIAHRGILGLGADAGDKAMIADVGVVGAALAAEEEEGGGGGDAAHGEGAGPGGGRGDLHV